MQENKFWIISYLLMFLGAGLLYIGSITKGIVSHFFFALSFPVGLTSGLAAGCTKAFTVLEQDED